MPLDEQRLNNYAQTMHSIDYNYDILLNSVPVSAKWRQGANTMS